MCEPGRSDPGPQTFLRLLVSSDDVLVQAVRDGSVRVMADDLEEDNSGVRSATELSEGSGEVERVLTCCPNTEMYILQETLGLENSEASLGVSKGCGTLVVSSKRVVWVSGPDEAIEIGYRQLNMHAVCNEALLLKRSCIYCQVGLDQNDVGDGAEDLCEVRFVPQDEAMVSDTFLALSKGASLFPCEDSDSDDGSAEASAAEMLAMMAGGMHLGSEGIITAQTAGPKFQPDDWGSALPVAERNAMLEHWDSLLVTAPSSLMSEETATGRFDDAEIEPAFMKFAGALIQEPPGPPPSQ